MGIVRNEVATVTHLVAALCWWMRRLQCPRCGQKFTSARPCACGLSATYW